MSDVLSGNVDSSCGDVVVSRVVFGSRVELVPFHWLIWGHLSTVPGPVTHNDIKTDGLTRERWVLWAERLKEGFVHNSWHAMIYHSQSLSAIPFW